MTLRAALVLTSVIALNLTLPQQSRAQSYYCPLTMLGQANGVYYYYCYRCPDKVYSWFASSTTASGYAVPGCDDASCPVGIRLQLLLPLDLMVRSTAGKHPVPSGSAKMNKWMDETQAF